MDRSGDKPFAKRIREKVRYVLRCHAIGVEPTDSELAMIGEKHCNNSTI